ncbi:MAG TPA: hypothetical protein VFL90_01495 [Methylomirabilota bacterium]|nr:hypothetical protein [Methylomirabilota bacterium]
MDVATIQPIKLFTLEALSAGWYFVWRFIVRLLLYGVGPAIIGGVLIKLGWPVIGGLLLAAGIVVALWKSFALVPDIASEWAEARYGHRLERRWPVYWGITWRVLVVTVVASFIGAVPSVIGVSFKTAYAGSLLGMVGGLLVVGVSLAQSVLGVMANGWAMSKVAAEELSGLAPVARPVPAPVATSVVQAPAPSAPAPVVTPPSPVSPGGAEGKRQCPKCGLYETERGSVIGWYCKVCGWRETRR